ncbi:hypothetical protein EDL81_04995 [Ehrlichia ruminantium]|uniref:hypothetical protein n=1 Tax=Ehrlichia ruminantium TaxID=779 RepID=UPI00130E5915|nr:hypothetical protein [Ehrlichia ruminantium]QGR02956.1 hypothetical protein EDL81_04995 [Ehrlichia ruminantium]
MKELRDEEILDDLPESSKAEKAKAVSLICEDQEDKDEFTKRLLIQHLKATFLKLDDQDIVRKKAVLTASAFGFMVFVAFAILQSNIIPFVNKNQMFIYSNVFDVMALLVGFAFILAALYNVFYLEGEKRRVDKQLKILQGEYVAETSKGGKVAKFLDKHANKVDLLGSVFTTTMQLIVILSLTLPGIINLSGYPVGSVFNIQGIVDTCGNILFVLAAGMFLLSYCIQQYKNKDKKDYKHNKQATFIMTALFSAMLLVCLGKIMFSLEATCGAIYTGHPGIFGDALPLALIIRSAGMLLFCVAYTLLLMNSIEANKQLRSEVSDSQLHSCLSYHMKNSDDVIPPITDQGPVTSIYPQVLEESLLEDVGKKHLSAARLV